MKYMTINNRRVPFENEKNVLTVIRNAGIELPTFCYHSELSTYGACRMCIVEDDRGKIFASCSEEPKDGMVIYTNSPKVRIARRQTVQLILSQHDCKCATCVRSGNCTLQQVANDLNLIDLPFKERFEETPWDKTFPLIRDSRKCIKCMRCIQICDKILYL